MERRTRKISGGQRNGFERLGSDFFNQNISEYSIVWLAQVKLLLDLSFYWGLRFQSQMVDIWD